MSWLISLVLAGAMFASDNGGSAPVQLHFNETENKNIARQQQQEETERFEQTYPLNANGRVAVSNVNGSITIDVWDKPEVKLEYVKTADSRERLAEVEVRIDARADSFTVETNFDKWKRRDGGGWNKNGKFEIEYRLTVPRSAVLDEIETVNGSINIANAANTTKASAVNGEIRATNLRGAANLSTVNGTIQAEFDALAAGGKISLDTVNGQVNLVIPSDANATVKADTLNGNITNDFGLPVRKGQYIGRDLYGRIGAGDAQIKLNSVNGGLSIKRRSDGKNTNPATNLLPQKSKADKNNDDDNDNDDVDIDADDDARAGGRNLPPLPPFPPMPKINQKEIQRALKDAQKEIAAIQPALENLKVAAPQPPAFANYFGGTPVIEKKSETFSVKGTPKVTIEAKNCDVFVRGQDKQEVGYSMVKISRGAQKSFENNSTISVKNTDSTVDIKVSAETKSANDGAFFDGGSKTRLEIFVPKKSNLKIVTDGEIRLEGVSGEIDLQGADESVNVHDTDGTLSVGTADGRIRVIGFRGAFDGKTADGEMNLEGDFSSFNALAADGTIILTLPENADISLEANTEVENDGLNLTRDKKDEKLWRVGKGGAVYRMSVADGKIIVRSANAMKIN